MAPSAKLSVLAEITKAPVRAAPFALRTSMLFNTVPRGVTPTFKFVGFSNSGSSSSASVGAVDTRVLADGTISALVFHVDTAPGAGNSLTLELLVNGTPSSLIATISGTNTTAVATGSVAVVDGDFLACQVGFVGIASSTIRSIGAVVSSRQSWNPSSGSGVIGSASVDSVPLQAVNITRVGFKDTNVTGSPTTIDVIVGGSTIDSIAVAAGINNFAADSSVNVSAGTTEVLLLANTSSLSGPGRMTTTYQNLDEVATLCLLAHDALYQWSLTNDPTFADWDGNTPILTEASKQGAWPLAGTITGAVVYVDQFTSTSAGADDVNVTYTLNVNGAPTAITHSFQKLSADRFHLFTGLTIHLNQGDLVSRVATPDNTNALNFKTRMLVTFVPD